MFTMILHVAGEEVLVKMHTDPHFEEVAALVALEDHGTLDFLGKYCPAGELELGTGGGPLDEHPSNITGEARKSGCCLTLLARPLGLNDMPWWRELIAFCHYADTGELLNRKWPQPVESSHPYDPFNLLKLRYRKLRCEAAAAGTAVADADLRRVVEQTMEEVRVLLWKQVMFLKAADELRDRGRVIKVQAGKKLVKVMMIMSDNGWISAAARSRHHADLVIQRNSSGQVHIFANQKSEVNLDDLAQMLKLEEQNAEGNVRVTDWRKLRSEGAIDEAGKWFYLPQHGQIHNGTESYPDTPATLLDDDLIAELIEVALDPDCFESTRAEFCRQGICNSAGVNDCPLHRYGLRRCRTVRFQMKSADAAVKSR